ncbi:MAG: hypothetical protein HY560_12190 [Gemmatimonadetes bacterium]|nr:hypothetical protein [Gemmatimonadota bacterium]
MHHLTSPARAALAVAAHAAQELGSAAIDSEHLFIGLCNEAALRALAVAPEPGNAAASGEEIDAFVRALAAGGLDPLRAGSRMRELWRQTHPERQPFSRDCTERCQRNFNDAAFLTGGPVGLAALLTVQLGSFSSLLDDLRFELDVDRVSLHSAVLALVRAQPGRDLTRPTGEDSAPTCTVCGVALPPSPRRFPNQVCQPCGARARETDGHPARHSSGDDAGDNPVWIDGLRCWRRYRVGGYLTMRDPDDCPSLQIFYLRHGRSDLFDVNRDYARPPERPEDEFEELLRQCGALIEEAEIANDPVAVYWAAESYLRRAYEIDPGHPWVLAGLDRLEPVLGPAWYLKLDSAATFRGTCPWCGESVNDRFPSTPCDGYRCTCGAIALGRPPEDFDELIDTAIAYYRLSVPPEVVSFEAPDDWMLRYGIEARKGGERKRPVGDVYTYYWFRPVGPGQSPPQAPPIAP